MGKFGISSLRKAEDLISLFYKTNTEVQHIRNSVKICQPSAELLYNIDEISNLCSIVADTSQAISDLFPSEDWKNAAYQVQDNMHELFSSLNHDTSMHNSLLNLKNSSAWNHLTAAQQFFALTLLKDLEKEGISLQTSTSLSILRLQSLFLYNIHTTKSNVEVTLNEIASVPTIYRPEREGDVYNQLTTISLSKNEIMSCLNKCPNPTLRLKLFETGSTSCKENSEVLTNLLTKREDFSKELGFSNFSSYALFYQSFPIDPIILTEKLVRCHEYVLPKLNNEYSILLDKKALEEQVSRYNPVSLHPSDIPYYINKYLESQLTDKFPGYTTHHSIKNYFTIYNVLEGVNNLIAVLFKIKCEIEICKGEETWSNDIIKITLCQHGKNLGYLYLDLFARPGKSSMPAAKFNVFCAKRKSLGSQEMQEPRVIISCNFVKSDVLSSNIFLTIEDLKQQGITLPMVQEFYHELGHALHSLLSKGDFQSYSGSRVPLDLAEIPSHVFEHFISDYDFIKIWAKHCKTNNELPLELFTHLQSEKLQFSGFSHHIQLSIAIFDLLLHTHSSIPKALENFNSILPCNELQNQWYCSIEHFVEYASCYYSYILDKSLSNIIWDTVFQRQAMNPKAGEIFNEHMLSQGGNIHPQMQLDNILKPFLILDEERGINKVDPFYVMEYWYKNYFTSTQLVSIEKLRSENKIFHR